MAEELKTLIQYVLKNLDEIICDADWIRLKLFRGELRTLYELLEKWPGYFNDLMEVFTGKIRNDSE